ncbi:MAG: hypothetical protein RJA61_133 [Candidatus Parcubacteria bacterium]|jgi:hypothetical protein
MQLLVIGILIGIIIGVTVSVRVAFWLLIPKERVEGHVDFDEVSSGVSYQYDLERRYSEM